MTERNDELTPELAEELILGSNDSSDQRKRLDDDFQEELAKQAPGEQVASESDVVAKAKHYGHMSKEQWIAAGKDPEKWKSENEFVQYGEQYKEIKDFISDLKRQNIEQAKKIDLLVEDRKVLAQKAVYEAKAELEMQLGLARERGDVRAVETLAQQKIQLDQQALIQEQQRRGEEVSKIDQLFLERNQHWFNDSRPDLKQKVVDVSNQIKSWYPTISYAELAHKVEERMKFEHPEINVNTPARPQVSLANSSVNKNTSESGLSEDERTFRSLSSEDRALYNVAKKLVEGGKSKIKYTVKDFVEQQKRGL